MNSTQLSRLWLCAILVAYVVLALSYSLATPLWEAPDEPSHYLYAQYLADQRALPPPQPPQRGYFYQFGYATSLYEWYQQPLYYTLLAPQLWLANVWKPETGELFPPINPQFEKGATRLFTPTAHRAIQLSPLGPRMARLFSILLGLLLLLATYQLARAISPHDQTLAWTATGFMAFIPQVTFITGYITNDNLSDLMSTLCLLAFARLLTRPDSQRIRRIASAGLLVSLALLTKLTLFFWLPLGLGCLLLRDRAQISFRSFLREALLFVAVALYLPALGVLLAPGMADQLAYANNSLQIRADYLSLQYVLDLWPLTHASFWGRFGWMNVATPEWITNLMDLLALIGLCSTLYLPVRRHHDKAFREQMLLLWLTCLLVLVGFIRFNFAVRQPQGRLLFSALSAFVILVSLGLLQLAGKYRAVAGFALVCLTLAINLVSLLTALLPAYSAESP